MPTYDFRCTACGERFEVVSSIAERDEKSVCPSCGSRKVETVFGSFAVGGLRTTLNPGNFVQQKGKPPKL
jgi:putative FmdB family regulatory protein